MIVLVEESAKIPRANKMVSLKGQWHRLQEPLRLRKEDLGRDCTMKWGMRHDTQRSYQCNAQVQATETANNGSKIRGRI
jgi:hypothetical protein